MTATVPVTVPKVATPAGPRSTATNESRDDAGTAAGFDSRLRAARQQRDAGSADDMPGKQADRSRMPAARSSLGQQVDSTQAADPGMASAWPAATPATVQVAETAETSEPDDQPASAMAGAMLALLGSSVAGVLPPAAGNTGKATGALMQADQAMATDAGATTLLQLGAADSPAAMPADTVPVAASLLATAVADLPASTTIDRDSLDGLGLPVVPSAPPAAAAAPTAMHQLQLPSPPGSQSFAQDLGQQVAWLGGQNIKQARIRLHPEELGPLDVSVSVKHGRVDVVFSAQHPAALSAVQQSLPQLDQMLARHGLSLGHAEVGQHDRGDRRGHAADGGLAAVDEAAETHGGLPVALGKVGLLDAFA